MLNAQRTIKNSVFNGSIIKEMDIADSTELADAIFIV